MVFPVVMYGCERELDCKESWKKKKKKLSTEELMLLNCGIGENSWESLGLHGVKPVHPKGNQSWIFIGRTDVEAETPVGWPPDGKNWLTGMGKTEDRKRRGNRGWDGWMASLTRWTWVWASSGSWLWTAKPDMLQSMGSQRVRHEQLNRTEICPWNLWL